MLTKSDWDNIRKEYRAGILSVPQLADIYEISAKQITNRANKDGWVHDMSKTVRKETQNRLTTMDGAESDEDIIDAAVERNLAVIRQHQDAINNVAAMEAALLVELGADPKKVWLAQYQGDVLARNLSLTVAEKAQTLKSLSGVMAQRITLERQLLNLDEADRNQDKLMISGVD
jgi:hypothetical protein